MADGFGRFSELSVDLERTSDSSALWRRAGRPRIASRTSGSAGRPPPRRAAATASAGAAGEATAAAGAATVAAEAVATVKVTAAAAALKRRAASPRDNSAECTCSNSVYSDNSLRIHHELYCVKKEIRADLPTSKHPKQNNQGNLGIAHRVIKPNSKAGTR